MNEDLVLTDDEERTVEEGLAAQLLLDNPAFLRAIERIRTQCAEAILTSDPQQRDAREDAYQLSRGLSAVTSELIAAAAEGETILENAKRATPNVDAEVQDDPDFTSDY